MRRLFVTAVLALALGLAACGDTRVQVKGGSETPPKWKIVKPF